MPAHRGLVCTGIYGWVRHPIYAGYLLTHVAFLVAHPAGWNLLLLVVSDLSLLLRAGYEERTLARDPEYSATWSGVRWKVCPACSDGAVQLQRRALPASIAPPADPT